MQIRAKKHLGQHFLNDDSIACRIVDSLTGKSQDVLEIGPGTGVLTRHLIKNQKINLYMTAKDFINPGFLPLRTSDTALTALSWMDEYRVSHLPVVNGIDYLGLISDSDIYNDADLDEPIGNHSLSLNHPFVEQNQHIYDVLKIMASLKLTLLPVLDDKNHYLGVITQGILIDEISNITSIQNPGATLVLEVSSNNYSLSEIAQIVESNDAKILSCFITSQPDSTEMDVTIRINRMDFYPILQTFNRYNYVVKASYGESNYYEDLQERYDMLMNYLNV